MSDCSFAISLDGLSGRSFVSIQNGLSNLFFAFIRDCLSDCAFAISLDGLSSHSYAHIQMFCQTIPFSQTRWFVRPFLQTVFEAILLLSISFTIAISLVF